MSSAVSSVVSDKSAVREMYAREATSYAAGMVAEIEMPTYQDAFARLHGLISTKSGAVIDTGCGSGDMLLRYHEKWDPARALFGLDLSPDMVRIASEKLGEHAQIIESDMRDLLFIESSSAVAVVNFYTLHHLDETGVLCAFREWNRVLKSGGCLLLAAWEGEGLLDYGGESDIKAVKYKAEFLSSLLAEAGFTVKRCVVEKASDECFPDSLFIDAVKADVY